MRTWRHQRTLVIRILQYDADPECYADGPTRMRREFAHLLVIGQIALPPHHGSHPVPPKNVVLRAGPVRKSARSNRLSAFKGQEDTAMDHALCAASSLVTRATVQEGGVRIERKGEHTYCSSRCCHRQAWGEAMWTWCDG